MRKVLLISPHYDDAVLSAGQFMAGRPDTEVLTLFNWRGTSASVQTTYDAKCGFDNADDAVHARQRENNEALALLQATSLELNLPDSQYDNSGQSDEYIVNRILELVLVDEEHEYEFMLAPLGLAHPDHEQAHRVGFILRKELGIPIYFWEDMPIRVVEPGLVYEKLKKLKNNMELLSPGTGPIADKIRALSCYKSQIGTGILDPYIMYVPERFWKYV